MIWNRGTDGAVALLSVPMIRYGTSGSFAALICIGLLLATMAAMPVSAYAQDDTAGDVLACDRIDDPSDRLACFSDLADRLRQGGARPSRTVAPRQAVPTAQSSAPTSTAVASAAVNAAVNPTDDFGADSMKSGPERTKKDKKRREERLQANIAKRWKRVSGHFRVELDNGQVWEETDGSKIKIPKRSTSVEIYRGRIGGYRMKIENVGRVAWVRRVK